MKKAILIIVLGLLWCNVGFAESSLPACKGTPSKKWSNCHGAFTLENGDKYVGEFKKAKWHGQGTLTRIDGKVEKGIWEKGQLVKEQ